MIIDTDILSAKKCPYCGGVPKYVDSSLIYGKSYGMIYLCSPCNALVGVHKGTDKPLGRLANGELREAKKAAHQVFDQIWKSGLKRRAVAYKWLSDTIGTHPKYTHIGMFDIDLCAKTIDACRNLFNRSTCSQN